MESVQLWNITNQLFFNNLQNNNLRSRPHFRSSPRLLFRCDPSRSKWRSKPKLPIHPGEPPFAPYSNRRISTGNSREASRAGTIVATIEMIIAAAAIHTPSMMLGKNGT